jgi:hypothetical protein
MERNGSEMERNRTMVGNKGELLLFELLKFVSKGSAISAVGNEVTRYPSQQTKACTTK